MECGACSCATRDARWQHTLPPCVQAALAELKKGTQEVNPDDESLQRLKALRGDAPAVEPAAKAKPAFRTAQVHYAPLVSKKKRWRPGVSTVLWQQDALDKNTSAVSCADGRVLVDCTGGNRGGHALCPCSAVLKRRGTLTVGAGRFSGAGGEGSSRAGSLIRSHQRRICTRGGCGALPRHGREWGSRRR